MRCFASLGEVHLEMSDWIQYYNYRRLHGSLKYKSPAMFIEFFKAGLGRVAI